MCLKSIKNYLLTSLIFSAALSGCSISEEVKRINQVTQMQKKQESARSADLTGEQIYLRSCNVCHPPGRTGTGPSLDQINDHYPDDEALKKLIREGRGMMPAQPVQTINDQELSNLIEYLRTAYAKPAS